MIKQSGFFLTFTLMSAFAFAQTEQNPIDVSPNGGSPEQIETMKQFCEQSQQQLDKYLENANNERAEAARLSDGQTNFDSETEHCHIKLTYNLDSNALIEHFIESSQGINNREQAVSFFNSQAAQDLIKRSFKTQSEEMLSDYQHPNITTEVEYLPSDELIKAFSFTLFKSEKTEKEQKNKTE